MDDIFNEECGEIAQIYEDTGIIRIHGLITQRPCWEQIYFGGCTTEQIHQAFTQMLHNDSLKQIVLDIDSPGGEVSSLDELSTMIYESRGRKDIVTICNSLMCSAAYWIGSAASKVYMAGKTAMAGSIGVVAVHTDVSGLMDKMGIKVTEIVAGQYKRSASQYKELDEFGQKTLQEQVDYLYSVFVAAIARNRGTSEENVLKRMADGRIFIGEQAVAVGIADGIQVFLPMKGMSMFVNGKKTGDQSPHAGGQAPKADEKDDRIKELEQENAELKKRIEELEKDAPEGSNDQEDKESKEEDEKPSDNPKEDEKQAYARGIKAERERIKAIDEVAVPGFEAIVTKAKDSGWSAEKTSMEILKAQKNQGISLAGIQRESSTMPFSFASPDGNEEQERASMAAMIAGKVGKK